MLRGVDPCWKLSSYKRLFEQELLTIYRHWVSLRGCHQYLGRFDCKLCVYYHSLFSSCKIPFHFRSRGRQFEKATALTMFEQNRGEVGGSLFLVQCTFCGGPCREIASCRRSEEIPLYSANAFSNLAMHTAYCLALD